jgi:hypothetical protein
MLYETGIKKMNKNTIITDDWSNPASGKLYQDQWPDEPELGKKYEDGQQCGGCAFFAPFNSDWGLCCHSSSRHFRETVFEHFTCGNLVNEGWGPHSFMENPHLLDEITGDPSQ